MPLPAWLAAAMPGLASGAVNVIGNLLGVRAQRNANMDMAKWQAEYNTPANQRDRMEDAGYNPNLFYGQGSPGNAERPQSPDIQSVLLDLGTKFQQNRLLKEQADLTGTKVDESVVKQELMRAQRNLTEANPHMRKEFVDSMVMQLESTAKLKKQESDFMLSGQQTTGATTQGQAKMMLEVNRLAQQFELGVQDQAIKAKIIESKEFQNALQQIQVNWMKDKEITPQHIYLGIMMLLQKMM